MKKVLSILILSAMLASLGSICVTAEDIAEEIAAAENTEANESVPAFSDIAGHWAEEIITKYKKAGIVNGYPDGTFQPDEAVNRAELAKIVTLAFGLTETSEVSYSDIDVNAWYYPYLQTAAAYIPCYCPPDLEIAVLPYEYIIPKNQFLPSVGTLRVHVAETLSLIYTKLHNITVEFPSDFDLLGIMKERFSYDGWYDIYYIIRPSQGVPVNQLRLFRYSWLVSELGLMQAYPDGYFYPYHIITRAELLILIDQILAMK